MKKLIGAIAVFILGMILTSSIQAQQNSTPGYIGKIVKIDKIEGTDQVSGVQFSVERVGTAPREKVEYVIATNTDATPAMSLYYYSPKKDRDHGKTNYYLNLDGIGNPEHFTLTIYLKKSFSLIDLLGISFLSATADTGGAPEDPEGTVIVLKYP